MSIKERLVWAIYEHEITPPEREIYPEPHWTDGAMAEALLAKFEIWPRDDKYLDKEAWWCK